MSHRTSPVTFAWTLTAVALATGVCFLMHARLDPANQVMVYLLEVAFVASRFGVAEAVLASVLSVASFDLLFVEPRGTFAVEDTQYLVTFAVMLAVALMVSGLTSQLRRQAETSEDRERRTAALYRLSRNLAELRSRDDLTVSAVAEIQIVFDANAVILLFESGRLNPVGVPSFSVEPDATQKALEKNEPVTAHALYLPLRGSSGAIGVLVFEKPHLEPEQLSLLETYANTLGLALERAQLARDSQDARVFAEAERIRNALLSSISHDLRTPLTAIAGAASSLRDGQGNAHKLAETIYDESIHLNLQVQNLLDMTRLQSGQVQPNLEWNVLEEIIGLAIARTAERPGAKPVTVNLPEPMPLLRIDGDLVEKVFANLFENVAAHAPSATRIDVNAELLSEIVRVNVADDGPGIAKGQESRIFERFNQARTQRGEGGFGLGLAIARSVMRLHEGRIWAENNPEGGAVFHLEFRKPTEQPEVPLG